MLAKKLLEVIPLSIRRIRKLSTFCLDGSYTIHHLRILFLIKEGMGQSQMAEVLQITPAAVCKTMTLLEKKNLITKKAGPDKRAWLISLTNEGKKILHSVSSSVELDLEKGLKILSKEEKEDLRRGLNALAKVMSSMNEV